jgi:TolA-binding protein
VRQRRFLFLITAVLVLYSCSADSAKSRYILAEKLWTDGSYAAAVREFERVVARDPHGRLGIQALFRAAMTQTLYLAQHDDAIRKFRSYVELVGEPALAWESEKQIGEILYTKTEQYDRAIQHYRAMIKARPQAGEIPEFLFRIGKSHFFLWQFDDAITTFRRLAKEYPQNALAEKASYEVGVTYFTRGEQAPTGQSRNGPEAYQEAMDAFQKFLRKYPRSALVPQAKFGIASCLEELDQLDAAYHQYQDLLTTYPSPKVIKIKLARIRQRQVQKSR